MTRLEIHVDTLVLDGLSPAAVPDLVHDTERALGDLLGGRTPAADPGDPAAALAAALFSMAAAALREGGPRRGSAAAR